MGRLRLEYVMEHSILRTELENSKSTAIPLRLVPASAEARDVSDACCQRQEILAVLSCC